MVEGLSAAYAGPSTVEIIWNGGAQLHTITQPTITKNCQGRDITTEIVNPVIMAFTP